MRRKGYLSLVMALVLVMLTGCGNRTGETEKGENNTKTQETGNTNASMGRYIEEEIILPEELAGCENRNFIKGEDGSYQIYATGYGGRVVSRDSGKTWKWEETAQIDKFTKNHFAMEWAVSKDGEHIFEYVKEEDRTEENGDYNPSYLYVNQEGEQKELELAVPEGGMWVDNFVFLEDGRLIASDLDANVCEYSKEDGSSEVLFHNDNGNSYFYLQEVGRYLMALYEGGSIFYDWKEEKLLEDTIVFDDFRKQTGMDNWSDTSISPFLVTEGESEEIIYLACTSGLYRYIIGGTVMEQMMTGNLSSLGDLSKNLKGMQRTEDGAFLLLYSDGTLMRCTYDEKVPTVPSTQLKVFSMEENATIRQAASVFQKENPEVYIQYEIGMTGEDGVSFEDAVKNMNAEWMAGNGADVYVLDSLNYDNYVQKGMLSDLTPYLSQIEDELFTNITHAMKEDSGIYALPTRFEMPLLYGEKQNIEQVKDLESMAELFEGLRKEGRKEVFLGVITEKQLISLLATTEAHSWMGEDGELQKDDLAEFLENAKRIYVAEMEEYPEEKRKGILEDYAAREPEEQKILDNLITQITMGDMQYLIGERLFLCGRLEDLSNQFPELVAMTKKMEGTAYQGFWLENKKCFLPRTVTGINSQSNSQEIAADFIKTIVSEKVQSVALAGGLPVNKMCFRKAMEKGGVESGRIMGFSDTEGNYAELEIPNPGKEEIEQLIAVIEQLDTINYYDRMLMDAVLELGPDAMNGSKETEAVVEEISRQMKIRLAE